MDQALFIPEKDDYRPTPSAGGPWDPAYLHGGPPVGLLAWALEREVADSGLQLARLTTDLLRPVPMTALTVQVEVIRRGRRLRVLEATLKAGDVIVSRACGLYLEQTPLELPEYARFASQTLPPAGDKHGNILDISTFDGRRPAFTAQGLHTTVHARLIDGASGRGRGRAWLRLPVPVVAGEPSSPAVQAATLADFGNGIAQLRVAEGMGCINADVTLCLTRPPVGQWLGFDASARMGHNGIGLVETGLYDEHGPVGRVIQAIMPMPVYGRD